MFSVSASSSSRALSRMCCGAGLVVVCNLTRASATKNTDV
jgi:hypothetical protein